MTSNPTFSSSVMVLLDWKSCFELVEATVGSLDSQAVLQHQYRVLTIETSISFFTEALRDPSRPTACAQSLLGAISLRRSRDKTGNLVPSLHLSDYFDTAISLLMSPETYEDVEDLFSNVSDCTCTMTPSSVSFYAHLKGYQILSNVVKCGHHPKHPAAELVATILKDVADALVRANDVKTIRGEQVKRWPHSINSFFPGGLRKGVLNLAWWQKALKVQPTNGVLVFAIGALRLCGDSLSYEIRNSADFTDAILSAFRDLVTKIRDSESLDEMISNARRLNAVTGLVDAVGNCMRDHHLLANWFSGESGVSLNDLLLDAALLFVNIDTSRLSGQGLAGFSEDKKSFVAFALLTSSKLPMHGSQALLWTEIIGRFLTPATRAEIDITSLMARSVAKYLIHMKRGKACLNEGCAIVTQGNMRLCAACMVVRYCSKDCQKHDWRHDEYPHKTVCKEIQTFASACEGGIPDSYAPTNLIFDDEVGRDARDNLWNWIQSRPQLYASNRYELLAR